MGETDDPPPTGRSFAAPLGESPPDTVKNKSWGLLPPDMKLSLTDPQGLFDTLIVGIILLSAIALAYLLLFGTY